MYPVRMVFFLFILVICVPVHAGGLTVQIYNEQREPLPDAVVYLVPDQAGTAPAPGDFVIAQKNKAYIPFVTVLPVGSKVAFSNRDGIGHHIYSLSAAKNFQLPLSEQEAMGVVSFDQPGLVTLGCNIHDWMAAYVYVVTTPYFAKSDAAGKAVIRDLPDGDYTLHVTHPGMKQATDLTRRINMAPGAGTMEEFTLGLKPEYFWRPAPQTDGEAY